VAVRDAGAVLDPAGGHQDLADHEPEAVDIRVGRTQPVLLVPHGRFEQDERALDVVGELAGVSSASLARTVTGSTGRSTRGVADQVLVGGHRSVDLLLIEPVGRFDGAGREAS